jgi:hypothetical protein
LSTTAASVVLDYSHARFYDVVGIAEDPCNHGRPNLALPE